MLICGAGHVVGRDTKGPMSGCSWGVEVLRADLKKILYDEMSYEV